MTDTPTTQKNDMTTPPKAPTLPFTIHSTGKEYYRRFGIGRVLLIIALLIFLYYRVGFEATIVTTIALAIVLPLVMWRLSHKRSVTFEDGQFIYNNGFGGTKVVPYDSVQDIVGTIYFQDMTFGSIPRLTVASKEGKPLLSLYGLYWDAGDLEDASLIFEAKNIKAQYVDQPISSAAYGAQFPHHVGELERHPIRYAFIFVGIILVVAVLFALAFM